jgi:hypothetical protein
MRRRRSLIERGGNRFSCSARLAPAGALDNERFNVRNCRGRYKQCPRPTLRLSPALRTPDIAKVPSYLHTSVGGIEQGSLMIDEVGRN